MIANECVKAGGGHFEYWYWGIVYYDFF